MVLLIIILGDLCIYYREENINRTESPIWMVYTVLDEILCRIGPCVLLVTLNMLMIRDFRTSIKRRKGLKNEIGQKEKNRRHKAKPHSCIKGVRAGNGVGCYIYIYIYIYKASVFISILVTIWNTEYSSYRHS